MLLPPLSARLRPAARACHDIFLKSKSISFAPATGNHVAALVRVSEMAVVRIVPVHCELKLRRRARAQRGTRIGDTNRCGRVGGPGRTRTCNQAVMSR